MFRYLFLLFIILESLASCASRTYLPHSSIDLNKYISNSRHDTITIPPGYYEIYSPIFLKSNIYIIGQHSKIKQLTKNSPVFYGKDVHNITLVGLSIIGPGNFENFWTNAESHKERGIILENCDNINILRTEVINFGQCGISCIGGNNISIIENRIEGTHRFKSKINQGDNFQFGISITSAYGLIPGQFTIKRNDISFVCQGIVTSQGNNITSDSILIANNKIHNIIGQHGIYCSSSNTIIVSNNIDKIGLDGIKIQASRSTINNVVIDHNVIRNCKNSHGILVASVTKSKEFVHNIKISNNYIKNVSRGLSLVGNLSSILVDSTEIDSVLYQNPVYVKSEFSNDIKIKNTSIGYSLKEPVLIINKNEFRFDISIEGLILNELSTMYALLLINANGIKLSNISYRTYNINRGEIITPISENFIYKTSH